MCPSFYNLFSGLPQLGAPATVASFQRRQAISCPGAFVRAVLSAWNTLLLSFVQLALIPLVSVQCHPGRGLP